jgi:hypothetical protein
VTTATVKTQEEAIKQAIKAEGYNIKGLKTFKGMEGMGGFNLTLYRGKTKVAFIYNEDHGGPNGYDMVNKEEWEHLKALCDKMPVDIHTFADEDITITCDPDIFVGYIINIEEDRQYWKRQCAKGIVAILHEDKEGTFRSFKQYPYTPANVAIVRKHFGDRLKEIVNDRFI